MYPGEYVSFDLDKGKDGRTNCVNVTGVLGGPLLVEHSEYRYKYFQKNPNPRRNEATVDDTVDDTVNDVVNETVEVEDNNDNDDDDDDNDPEQ